MIVNNISFVGVYSVFCFGKCGSQCLLGTKCEIAAAVKPFVAAKKQLLKFFCPRSVDHP